MKPETPMEAINRIKREVIAAMTQPPTLPAYLKEVERIAEREGADYQQQAEANQQEQENSNE